MSHNYLKPLFSLALVCGATEMKKTTTQTLILDKGRIMRKEKLVYRSARFLLIELSEAL
jgi:hypothetical protein